MAEQLEDGTGTGKRAKINNSNQLSVAAEVVPEITHISSIQEAAYQFDSSRTLIAGNTFESVLFVEYNGEFQFQIDGILFSREDVALSGSGQAVFQVITKAIYTSGGDVLPPKNVNLSSSNLVVSTAYSGTTTLVLDTTNKEEIIDIALNDNYNHDFKGALILKKGDSIAILGKSLNIGDCIHAVVFGYEVTEII